MRKPKSGLEDLKLELEFAGLSSACWLARVRSAALQGAYDVAAGFRTFI
jgi:hypothetical protein